IREIDEGGLLELATNLARATTLGTVIYLHGPLGAGKTTVTRGFLRGLGFADKVKSPTYTIVEPYTVAGKNIYHFDLYRVAHHDELQYIGLKEYFDNQSI